MRNYKEFEIQVEIENSCLLNCSHCSSYEMRKMKRTSYPEATLIRFIKAFCNPVHVYLTGGDPALYPNLVAFCEKISCIETCRSVGLYTTGNCAMMKPISSTYANQLVNAGVTDCYLSIYHCTPGAHDSFTEKVGSFSNTLSSIYNLKDAGIIPKAHLVLTKQNKNDLDDIIRFCEHIGLGEVRILRLAEAGSAKYNWDKIGIPIAEQDSIIASLINRKDEFHIKLSFSGYPQLHACRSLENACKCQAGTNLLYITLSGEVYPCACTIQFSEQYRLGNISNPAEVIRQIECAYPHDYNLSCLNGSMI